MSSYPAAAGVWLHGEAVAAGTVMAADLSHRLGWIDRSLYDRARNLLASANLPITPPKVGTLHKFCPYRKPPLPRLRCAGFNSVLCFT